MSAASSSNTSTMSSPRNPPQQQQSPSPPLLDGSVSLKSQVLAMSAQNSAQSAARLSTLQPPGSRGRTTTQLDPSILARMVTAKGGASSIPIRVASMQEFRRSRNSLNTVPESSIQPRRANQTFQFQDSRRSTMGPMPSNNPLLKMMEQRMAANAANSSEKKEQRTTPSPAMAAMSSDNKVALQASIDKWAGIGQAASSEQSQENKAGAPAALYQPVRSRAKQSAYESPQLSSSQGSPSGRVPLSPPQIGLLNELTASQTIKKDEQASNKDLLKMLLTQRTGKVGQNATTNAQQVNPDLNLTANAQQAPAPVTSAHPTLTRSAVSLAEIDRLRRENQNIQLRQQLMMMQERAVQEELHQRNIAASALASMPSDGEGQEPLTQERLNQIQLETLNGLKRRSSKDLQSLAGVIPPGSLSSFRKRRSKNLDIDDDESTCTRGSLTSHTHSVTSSAASSNKIHRSLSHSSARAALTGSMENLRIKSGQNLLNGSMRNQSFSSGLNLRNSSYSTGLSNMQSFSSGSRSSLPKQRRTSSSSQAALRRTSSGNNWIKSLLSEQNTAGKAAATFEITLQNENILASLAQNQQCPSPPKQEAVVQNSPIQVQAEEYNAPPIERPPSTSSEKIIISAVPDRIKYQDIQADTKPIEIVKEALSSRGGKCDTKPSIDMEEGFFVNVTEMYDQDIVNAIRSNDVESLRKLHADGTNLQCGNRFGETLIHLACRRSHKDLVSFLVKEAKVSLRVRDDFGRTPMHDTCWRAEPDLELLDMLLDDAPELLMLTDKRGHTPLDYSRREHWDVLVPFLLERTAKFRSV